MTQAVSLLPQQTGGSFPAPNVDGLTDDEQRLVNGLSNKLMYQSSYMWKHNAYYEGTQRLQDLGIMIPAQLAGVRTVVDWPRIVVDPLVQRAVVDGFRMPGQTDVDDEMAEIWQANDMDAEAPLAFLDELVYGRGFLIGGSPDRPGDMPIMTVESPLNMTLMWDPRTRQGIAAYQAYEVEGVFRAALYQRSGDVFMSRDASGSGWVIDNRDAHNFGELTVTRLANRQRASDRDGRSQITPAIMNTTDSVVRTLLGMEIAREFYSIPHRYVLGASESQFVDAQGNKKTALELSMNKFVAFERDENGNLPTVGQFQAFDPSVFTKIVDSHAQLMASYTGYPPSYFGLTSTANPASADAIRVAMDGLNRAGLGFQNQNSTPLERHMGVMWRLAHNGAPLPAEMKRLETDWVDVATATPAATADALFKQAQMGSIPPTSDVTLKRLGYTAVERERLAADRALDEGAATLAELANSLQAKEARTDLTVARDINPAAVAPVKPNDGTGTISGK